MSKQQIEYDAVVDVTIKGAAGKPATLELKGVNSIMEVPNDIEGVMAGLSFYHKNHWQDFKIDEFESIIIRRRRPEPTVKHIRKAEVK